MTTINKTAIFAIFSKADDCATNFTEQLLALGVGDKATAKPLAMEWASKKYDVAIVHGRQGDNLPADSAARKAMYRVLDICFPREEDPALAFQKKAANDTPTESARKALKGAINKALKAGIRRATITKLVAEMLTE